MANNNDYDKDIDKIRFNLAKEKNDWYIFFKERNQYTIILIISLFITWILLSGISIFFKFNLFYLIFVPNGVWAIFVAPYFVFKIFKLSAVISAKKEEVVVNLYKTKTQNVKKLALLSGVDESYVSYYLEKNNVILNSKDILDNKSVIKIISKK
jgi:hypothetical protein